MATGDYVQILHNAGAGNTFSYTTAAGVDLVITNIGGINWGLLEFNNWVNSTTGVNYWALEADVGSGKNCRMLLLENQTIGKTDVQINTHGISLTCVQG